MNRSLQLTTASVLTGTVIALIWLKAPVVPAVLGALAAGLLLHWRPPHDAKPEPKEVKP